MYYHHQTQCKKNLPLLSLKERMSEILCDDFLCFPIHLSAHLSDSLSVVVDDLGQLDDL